MSSGHGRWNKVEVNVAEKRLLIGVADYEIEVKGWSVDFGTVKQCLAVSALQSLACWQYFFCFSRWNVWLRGERSPSGIRSRRSFWQRNHFPDINVGEDTSFVWNDPEAAIVALSDNRWMAALIHPGNTSAKRIEERCWMPCSFDVIRELIGKDWEFYAGQGTVSPVTAG